MYSLSASHQKKLQKNLLLIGQTELLCLVYFLALRVFELEGNRWHRVVSITRVLFFVMFHILFVWLLLESRFHVMPDFEYG
ncbi:hypothetical protein D3C81_2251660 [compost metagenome]